MPITTRIGSLSSRGFGQFSSKNLSALRVEYLTSYVSTVNTITVSFASISIGSASADRVIGLTVGAVSPSSAITVSATVNGQAANRAAGATSRIYSNAVFTQAVPSGTATSATFSVTSPITGTPSFNSIRFGIFAIYGLGSQTPVASFDVSTAQFVSQNLTTQTSGIILASAMTANNLSLSITLSGVTRRYNLFNETTRAGGEASNTVSGTTVIRASSTSATTINISMAGASFK